MVVLAFGASGLSAAEDFGESVKRATLTYSEKLRTASDELNRARDRIAAEKAPLLRELRATEDRIIAAESQMSRYETGQEQAATERRNLLKDLDAVRKSASYLVTLSHDSVKALQDGLSPAEDQLTAERLQSLQQKLDDTSAGPPTRAVVDTVEFLVERTQRAMGGYSSAGTSLVSDSNQVVKGTFAFVGPETFFRADQGGLVGTVRARQGATYPVTYALAEWNPADASAFFEGKLAKIPADSSGGKALRLRDTQGTLWEHVQKGGIVAYAIIVVGLLALLMIVQKLRELSKLAVDTSPLARAFLDQVAAGARADAQAALPKLKTTTRELFSCGLTHAHEPKALLEERLEAVLLGQRLVFERRLPLLAVIATAAPLMGLLGTVVGMVKTFALITVFGTGNAGKLSSGISEVLVATELGLAVAIPTLVTHGFLAHRVHKNLALLERQALEFVTAIELARSDIVPPVSKEALPA